MALHPTELELPLGNADAGPLAARRIDHLGRIAGVDHASLIRLTRAFPSLGSIYGASEAELTKVVGAVTAARIRWFLDAPLNTGVPTSSATFQAA